MQYSYYNDILTGLSESGNLRHIPHDRTSEPFADFSTNDYLGFGSLTLRDYVTDNPDLLDIAMTSSASRLLAATQQEYTLLEKELSELYPGKSALIFNSGYHANTGIVSALADRSTVILADRLVHASIIDGIMLSRARLQRFRHNDLADLERLLAMNYGKAPRIWIVVESVYSMDGDTANIDALIAIKKRYPGVMLYVDEAHAFGVNGPHGLGFTAASSHPHEVDVMVATFGKALASYGAFAIVDETLRQYLLNRARSFIFSTSLSPLQVRWSRLMIQRMIAADALRDKLQLLTHELYDIISAVATPPPAISHIQPLITGDATVAVELSQRLRDNGIIVLPIRTPTVPAGTERLRFSVSAGMNQSRLTDLKNVLLQCVKN